MKKLSKTSLNYYLSEYLEDLGRAGVMDFYRGDEAKGAKQPPENAPESTERAKPARTAAPAPKPARRAAPVVDIERGRCRHHEQGRRIGTARDHEHDGCAQLVVDGAAG